MSDLPPISPAHVDIANPVQRAERLHLERSNPTRRWHWMQGLFLWTFAASLLLSGLLGLTVRTGASTVPLGNDPRATYEAILSILSTVNYVLLVLTFIEFLLMVAQALMTAAHSIAREKRGGTWDILALTPVSAWQIITGKWWGVLGALVQDHQRGILLRVGVIFWLGLTAGSNGVIPQTLDMMTILIATLMILVFTVLNVSMAAALGILASCFTRRESSAFLIAGALHLAVIFLGGAFGLFFPLDFEKFYAYIFRMDIALSPLDGGTLFAVQILITTTMRYFEDYLLPALLSVPFYLGLTFGALELARRVVRRQGAAGRL